MTQPRFSVVISTYNWPEALELSIRSALAQTVEDIEVIVVGDACTDDTEERVRAITDPRVRFTNLETNHGSQWAANNAGIALSRSPLIAYLGHDDVWHPRHLEHLEEALATCDAAGAIVKVYSPPETGIVGMGGLFRDGVFGATSFVPPTAVAHRRAVADALGGWRNGAELRVLPDRDFLHRIWQAGFSFRSTGKLTAFKFAAGWRRDAYVTKNVDAQRAVLAALHSPRRDDFIADELTTMLQAFCDGRLVLFEASPNEDAAPGESLRLLNRVRGLLRDEPSIALSSLGLPHRVDAPHSPTPFEWHLAESSEGVPFRWSGPNKRASLEVPIVVDVPVRCRMTIVGAIDPRTFDELRISVQGTPLRHTLGGEGGSRYAEFDLAPAALGPHQVLRIDLEIETLRRPCDLGVNADTRWLGLAVGPLDFVAR